MKVPIFNLAPLTEEELLAGVGLPPYPTNGAPEGPGLDPGRASAVPGAVLLHRRPVTVPKDNNLISMSQPFRFADNKYSYEGSPR